MKKLANLRTLGLLAWIIFTVIMVVSMPNMEQLVREKGQITIPETTQSEIARTMMNEMNPKGVESYDIIAVFHSGNDAPLTTLQQEEIKNAIDRLKMNQQQLGIEGMTTHTDNEETAKQLVSADRTTILTQIAVNTQSGSITEVTEQLYPLLELEGVQAYLTGNEVVMEDFVKSTEEGIKKTEIIAVIFILIILIVVFRSPVVPLISLLTVGVSYLVSMGIVAHLVDQFNYPFSNFTQIFLIVILFGIGTDYNILLYTRYKEELSKTDNVLTAIKTSYQSAGKTVLYSGLAVFIGFMALILAKFQIYRSSSAVAIGVAVLILVLLTLNPFFMAILGRKMFWPIKRFEGHGQSRLWRTLSQHSVRRPFIALICVFALCLPFALQYSGTVSYNDLQEVKDSYTSKQGINIIEEHFSAGFAAPTSVVLQMDRKLDNSEDLQALDDLAEKISRVEGVSNVLTATRPAGEKINALYINAQTEQLYSGLHDASEGIGAIGEGLASAEEQFNNEDTSGLANVQKLIEGTQAAAQGATDLGNALNQLAEGVNAGASGAKELQEGMSTLKERMNTLSQGVTQVTSAYTQLEGGLSSFVPQLTSVGKAIEGAILGYEQIETAMNAFVQAHEELAEDTHIQTTLGIASKAIQELTELNTQLNQLVPQYSSTMNSFREANTSMKEVNNGLLQIAGGIDQLQNGSAELESGLKDGAEGSTIIADKSMELSTGISQIHQGQKQLLNGLHELEGKMGGLKSGLAESSAGFAKINQGLNEAQDYLSGLSESKASQKFYIPQDVLEGEDFQRAINMYMSNDRQMVRMMIILEVNPYSKEAMTIARNVDEQLRAAMLGSSLDQAKAAVGGKSSQNADLQEIASSDLTRTAIIMLLGIGLVLIVITASFWQPVFIIASLLLAYITALGMSELIGIGILDVDDLGWNVPFFGFIMIVALGVDYSIFLMMRYRELKQEASRSIIEASSHIGGVVISAAIILGGTFAALIPSGVLTLMEIAIVVIIGLLFLSFVMLPIFIPALISVVEKLNGKKQEK